VARSSASWPLPCSRARGSGGAAAADDQAQPRRQVIQEVGHPFVDRPRLDQVVIVEDQRERLRPGLELVGEGGHHDLAADHAGRCQKWKYLLGEAAARTVERADHTPEPDRVVVLRIEREPCDRPVCARGPVGQEARLAEAGRCAHHDQLLGHALVEAIDQA
jgi:hypothetical protein